MARGDWDGALTLAALVVAGDAHAVASDREGLLLGADDADANEEEERGEELHLTRCSRGKASGVGGGTAELFVLC